MNYICEYENVRSFLKSQSFNLLRQLISFFIAKPLLKSILPPLKAITECVTSSCKLIKYHKIDKATRSKSNKKILFLPFRRINEKIERTLLLYLY